MVQPEGNSQRTGAKPSYSKDFAKILKDMYVLFVVFIVRKTKETLVDTYINLLIKKDEIVRVWVGM